MPGVDTNPMTWQDVAFGLGQFLFALALVPALRSRSEKPPRSTCWLTGAILLVFAVAYASLGLGWGAAAAGLCATAWLVLLAQPRGVRTSYVEPSEEELWSLLREYHGFPTDQAMVGRAPSLKDDLIDRLVAGRDAVLEEAASLCQQESVKLHTKYCEAMTRDWHRSAHALSTQWQQAAALADAIRALKNAAPQATGDLTTKAQAGSATNPMEPPAVAAPVCVGVPLFEYRGRIYVRPSGRGVVLEDKEGNPHFDDEVLPEGYFFTEIVVRRDER